ncbi:MAG: DNA adenine methylase [Bacteroidales bacterium]|nr:DNA adenine methylase [Bacteroidales bacterium]MDD4215925.1 DNA adenine methylase [Bacteroidales bacterium]MDY0141059.1 DNA adenine methylase [Bacteroidales bacterium]
MFKYPKVNYIGNKEKIAKWICDQFPIDAKTLFDAFSGGCSLSYEAKFRGLEIYTNDILKINYHIANALIQNNSTVLSKEDIEIIFSGEPFEGFMFKNYSEMFFFADECKELDLYRANIENLDSEIKKSLAFTLMRRTIDSLFDLNYISFTDEGEIIFSKRLSNDVVEFWKTYQLDKKILNEKRLSYLAYHRELLTKKDAVA